MDFDDALREVEREMAATTALEAARQKSLFYKGVHTFSLDAIWRAVGSPEEKTPAFWLAFGAGPEAIDDVCGSGVPLMDGLFTREDFVFTLDNDVPSDPNGPWIVGDTMAVLLLAEAYARFVDGHDAEA